MNYEQTFLGIIKNLIEERDLLKKQYKELQDEINKMYDN